MLKTSENGFSIQKAIQSHKNRKLSTSGGNGGIGNVEGRYDVVHGHRTGSNNSLPLSVSVSLSPVSREASHDLWRSIGLSTKVVFELQPSLRTHALCPKRSWAV